MADLEQNCILVVEQIFPKASELSEILNYNPCPEYGCTEVFNNPPNLEMHLKKVHGKEDGKNHVMKQKNVIRQYYCPVIGCKYMYNPDSFAQDYRYFSQHKYLKQHYIKVHMEKKYICEQCGKGFVTEQQRKRHHLDECGLKFVCSCSAEYSSVSALQTHAARKNHTFVRSWSPVKNKKIDQASLLIGNNKKSIVLMPVILPKPPEATVTSMVNSLSEFSSPQLSKYEDKGIQTEPGLQRRRRNTLKSSDTSRQTQTGDKRLKISSETQTVGEYSVEPRSKGKPSKVTNRRRKKSMETQTCVNKNKTQENNNNLVSLNPVLDINSLSLDADITLPIWWNCESTSTQTSLNDIPTLSLVKTETEMKEQDIQRYFSTFSEENAFDFNGIKDISLFSTQKESIPFDDGKSCSTETQTDCNLEMLLNNCSETLTNIETQTPLDLLDQYSNMCTQTCDEILFSDFGFSDIETQTAWPDFDISFADTETQTMPSPNLSNNF